MNPLIILGGLVVGALLLSSKKTYPNCMDLMARDIADRMLNYSAESKLHFAESWRKHGIPGSECLMLSSQGIPIDRKACIELMREGARESIRQELEADDFDKYAAESYNFNKSQLGDCYTAMAKQRREGK